VVFRVAGDAGLGFGHVRRCWTLAGRLREAGARVMFVAASQAAVPLLARAGFQAAQERGDLEGTLAALQGRRGVICVVDDPTLDTGDLRRLRARAPVVCIDDTADRDLPVDLVLNASAAAADLPYRGNDDTRWLLGPVYVLLRPEFAGEPRRAATVATVRRVLVVTGGGDAGSLPVRLALAVHGGLPEATVDLVFGPFAEADLCGPAPTAWLALHRDPADVRGLMLGADLALTAGGQTAYELAATATPAIGLRLADNQEPNLRGLVKAGCLRSLGSPHDRGFWQSLRGQLADLAAQPGVRAEMGRCGRALVDGRGADRVAAAILELLPA
jgi:spore coat polysaccharide biosynthesis predicted glycosyltransferase SpsG